MSRVSRTRVFARILSRRSTSIATGCKDNN